VLGFDATLTGLALLPGALATAVSMPIAGRMARFLDARASIATGLAMFAAGSWMLGYLNANAGIGDIFWPRVLQGFALGFLFVPLTTATLSSVPRARMSNATGLYTLVRQLGGGFGIAILQLVQQRSEDAHYAVLASGVTAANPAVSAMLHGATNVGARLSQLEGIVTLNATVMSYNDVFRICALVFVASIASVFLLNGKRAQAAEAALIAE
jgi:DHA2 family multidrug resistance protein